ncbi:hypothetical protein PUN28_017903 [Cardiocondyla obscurior]|uniref:Uncharacterized protein n=1 Tax=Cardiocondyla obscurior TaxID=286306 RepID=A0AAW2EJG7_9HYME
MSARRPKDLKENQSSRSKRNKFSKSVLVRTTLLYAPQCFAELGYTYAVTLRYDQTELACTVLYESPQRRHLLQYRTERPGGRRRRSNARRYMGAGESSRYKISSSRIHQFLRCPASKRSPSLAHMAECRQDARKISKRNQSSRSKREAKFSQKAPRARMHRVVHESPQRRHLLQYRTERPGGRRRTGLSTAVYGRREKFRRRADLAAAVREPRVAFTTYSRASCCFWNGVTSERFDRQSTRASCCFYHVSYFRRSGRQSPRASYFRAVLATKYASLVLLSARSYFRAVRSAKYASLVLLSARSYFRAVDRQSPRASCCFRLRCFRAVLAAKYASLYASLVLLSARSYFRAVLAAKYASLVLLSGRSYFRGPIGKYASRVAFGLELLPRRPSGKVLREPRVAFGSELLPRGPSGKVREPRVGL